MDGFFKIEELMNAVVHEHLWYMDIQTKSSVEYVVSCSSCNVMLCLGWWSLKTGHRYCVENKVIHFESEGIVQALECFNKQMPVPGIQI